MTTALLQSIKAGHIPPQFREAIHQLILDKGQQLLRVEHFEILTCQNDLHPIRKIMKEFKVSRSTAYRDKDKYITTLQDTFIRT